MKINKQKLGYIEGWLSAITNIILFVVKLWAGILIGSIAMIADAWHTLSDTLTSLVVIIGFWISDKPADKEHPFGHGRAEFISAIIIGVFLAVVGVNFLIESVKRLQNPSSVSFSIFSIIIFAASILIKEALSQFAFWAGKQIKSESIIADGWHHRSDAIASALIVIGALFGKKFWWIDGVLGIGVSILILYLAFDIIKNAASTILGEDLDKSLENKIRDIIKKSAPLITNIHHLHLHKYGNHQELTIHIRVNRNMNILDSHKISKTIEKALNTQLNFQTTVHIEPEIKNEILNEPFYNNN